MGEIKAFNSLASIGCLVWFRIIGCTHQLHPVLFLDPLPTRPLSEPCYLPVHSKGTSGEMTSLPVGGIESCTKPEKWNILPPIPYLLPIWSLPAPYLVRMYRYGDDGGQTGSRQEAG